MVRQARVGQMRLSSQKGDDFPKAIKSEDPIEKQQ